MTDQLPARRRDPDQLLRLHDELDELVSSGVGWKSGSILAVIVASLSIAVVRLGTTTGLGIEFIVIVVAAISILAGIGIAKSVGVRSLRREIRRLEEETADFDRESA